MFETDLARPPFPIDPSLTTGSRSSRSLRRAVEALVLVHPKVRRLPDDDHVMTLASEVGIAADDFVTVNVSISGRSVSLVCPCKAAWREPYRQAFFELKAASALSGRAVVLVPEAFVRREPRLGNVLLIAGAEGTHIGLTDRMTLLAFLVEEGGSAPLLDLAGLVRGPVPMEAVMQLVVEGGLYIDLDQTILPSSTVHLVQP